jgi:hypothetical protein
VIVGRAYAWRDGGGGDQDKTWSKRDANLSLLEYRSDTFPLEQTYLSICLIKLHAIQTHEDRHILNLSSRWLCVVVLTS